MCLKTKQNKQDDCERETERRGVEIIPSFGAKMESRAPATSLHRCDTVFIESTTLRCCEVKNAGQLFLFSTTFFFVGCVCWFVGLYIYEYGRRDRQRRCCLSIVAVLSRSQNLLEEKKKKSRKKNMSRKK